MAKRYFWLKLKEDFFRQPKIKKLRRIAGGDTYTIIYLKMQLLSLKDEGRLFFEGTEDNFADEIALTIDEDPENVRVTIAYLMRQGLLEQRSDEEYMLPQTVKSIGSEADSTERVRRFRERQKELLDVSEQLQSNNNALLCNDSETHGNTEIEIKKELDINLESDTSTNVEVSTSHEQAHATTNPVSYKQIQDLFNEICVHYPKCQALSENRKKAIKARINSGMTIEDFRTLFEKAEASTFLRGGNDRNWHASFDWLIKDTNMVKVLEGNYDNKGVNGFGRNYGSAVGIGDSAPDDQKISGGLRL